MKRDELNKKVTEEWSEPLRLQSTYLLFLFLLAQDSQ